MVVKLITRVTPSGALTQENVTRVMGARSDPRHSGTWRFHVCSHRPYGANDLGCHASQGSASLHPGLFSRLPPGGNAYPCLVTQRLTPDGMRPSGMRALLSSVRGMKMRGLDSGLNLRYNHGLPSRPEFQEDRGAHFHAQAHISTQSPQTREDARISRADEDQERRSRVEPPSRHWPQARVS
jgi:hypothetical protein